MAGWELLNRWRIDTAFRYGLLNEAGDQINGWAPSIVFKRQLGEKWATHVEYFGIFSSNKEINFTRHYISPGVHYLVTPELEIGTRVGWSLNDQTPNCFANAGFGWRY